MEYFRFQVSYFFHPVIPRLRPQWVLVPLATVPNHPKYKAAVTPTGRAASPPASDSLRPQATQLKKPRLVLGFSQRTRIFGKVHRLGSISVQCALSAVASTNGCLRHGSYGNFKKMK